MIASLTTNKASVARNMVQPQSMTAAASSSGQIAAMKEPMNGTNRISIASTPHRMGFGTPMNESAMPMTQP